MAAGLDEALLARKVAAALELPAVQLEPLSPGSSRGAMRVLSPDGEPTAFLRIDLGIQTEVTAGKSLVREMETVRRAHALGFPVPRVIAMLTDPSVAVMELAAGTARPDDAEAERVGPEFMGHIARLHSIPPAEFGMAAAPTLTQAIADDLDTYEADARGRGLFESDVIRLGFRVLRATMPRSDEPPAMLHGDVGAGNFMVHDGRVSAILDWELAHAGDVHEDLAWLWVRGAHTPFGDPRQRVAEYEAAAGAALDPQRLAWHVALVTLKSVIGLHRRMHAEGEDRGLLTIEIARLAYETLLCAGLARVLGIAAPEPEEAPVSVRDAEARLTELVGLLEPPALRETQVLLRYLQTQAEQRAWREWRLREAARSRLDIAPQDIAACIDAAEGDRLAGLTAVLAADAWRRCKASPNAERRVRRALAIGYGQ